ncbi:fimbrial protein [Cronobacter dublinensis]
MVDNGSKSASVEMGEATSGQFQQAGATGDWVDFELSLSQCPSSVTQVTSTFNGTADTDAPDYFASTGTGNRSGPGAEFRRSQQNAQHGQSTDHSRQQQRRHRNAPPRRALCRNQRECHRRHVYQHRSGDVYLRVAPRRAPAFP